ncbi:MAG TPA: HEAT repeat domain-containing protein [Planctomycetota bacterium]|nr:HEAT repeat domain-containing protein [Planctomycetota bacterium]
MAALLFFTFTASAMNIEPPPDPGFDVSVLASDVIAEVEIVAGGPFRAVALVKKTLRGEAPKFIELEGFNSFNWDTVHHGLQAGTQVVMFLSKTERPGVFVPLTPAAPRFAITSDGVMVAFGDPPLRFPVKSGALEEGLSLLIERNASGKTPSRAGAYLRGLWEQGEIESRYIAVEMAGSLHEESALPLLVEASKDKLLKLRVRSIEALGKIGTPAAIGALRSLLADDKKTVAREAARALTLLRDADSIPALLEWTRKNSAASKNGTGALSDTDQTKTESVALQAINLAQMSGPFIDAPKVARTLLEIAHSPSEKLSRAALDACMAVAPVESVPALIELAQDRLFDSRDHAFLLLRRMALKPVRDIDEFQTWWKDAGSKFNEDARRDAAEAAARGLAQADNYDDRHKFLDTLRGMPGGIAVVSASPFLLNAKASANFGEDDLAAWNTPLVAPFLVERLGRDSASGRRAALEALAALCAKSSRLNSALWPLIRAHLAERDASLRREAESAVGALSQPDGIVAMLDACAARGQFEPEDCTKNIYTLTARTFGLSLHEPVEDQDTARRHLRGWWEGARHTFKPLFVTTPVNPYAIFPGEATRLRVYGSLDDSARMAKLEALALAEDSDISEAAFGVLIAERGADDAFWKKMLTQGRLRDRARGLIGSLGSSALTADLVKRLSSKDDAEPPLARALSLLSLAAPNSSAGSNTDGVKAIAAWLKSSDLVPTHPLKRLGVLCLGLASKEPDSLAYLNEIVDGALKTDAPDPDAPPKADDPQSVYNLLRSALIALCARDDGNAALLKLLNDSPEARIRETAARALSLRRERAAIPGLVKALDKSDRYTWLDLTHVLEPLLNADDGAVLGQMLESLNNTTRAAAVWILSRKPDWYNDAQMRAKLLTALSDDSSLVRYYAAESLGKRKAKSALDLLVKLLDDFDDDVKAAAAQALGELRDKDACVAASKAALGMFKVDARWMKALAISGNQRYFADIMKLANSNIYMEQRAGLEALAASDSDTAKDYLMKIYHDENQPMQSYAGDLIAARSDALELLKSDLESKVKTVRARAYHLLARINTPASRSAIESAEKTEDDADLKLMLEWALKR